MDLSGETVRILLFLIPGLLSSVVLNTLIVRKDKDSFNRVAEAMVFSFVIYTIIATVTKQNPVLLIAEKVGDKTVYSIQYNARVLWPMLGFSLLIPLGVSFLITTDVLMALLRRLKVTRKTERETVWMDVFTDQQRYVIVNLKDGRRVFGWPMYYSDTPEEGMLYLYRPSWIDENQKYIDLNIHGLFLIKEDIASIEFTLITKENAKEKQEDQHE